MEFWVHDTREDGEIRGLQQNGPLGHVRRI